MRLQSNENLNEIRIYFDDIKDISHLTTDEEVELGKRILDGDRDAVNALAKANLKFAVKIANEYQGKGVPFPDLIAEANMGLLHAARKFDYTKGYRFISYAVYWIRCYIEKFIERNSVRVEGSETEPFVVEDAERQYDDSVAEETYDDYEERIERYDGRNMSVRELVSCLGKRERYILEMFYGLGGGEELTLTDISKKMNLSVEGVRQIISKSIDKMKMSAIRNKEFHVMASVS